MKWFPTRGHVDPTTRLPGVSHSRSTPLEPEREKPSSTPGRELGELGGGGRMGNRRHERMSMSTALKSIH